MQEQTFSPRCGDGEVGPVKAPDHSYFSRDDLIRAVLTFKATRKEDDFDVICKNCKGLIVKMALRYLGIIPGGDLDDLIACGYMGLYEAALDFKPELGNSFLTYAVWLIRKNIFKCLRENSLVYGKSEYVSACEEELKRVEDEFLRRHGRLPERKDLLRAGFSESKLRAVRHSALKKRVISLDNGFMYGGKLCSFDVTDLESEKLFRSAEEELDQPKCLQILRDNLKEKEYDIVVEYFGLDGEEPKTLHAIGKEMSLTRERIRQIVAHALKKRPLVRAMKRAFGVGRLERARQIRICSLKRE